MLRIDKKRILDLTREQFGQDKVDFVSEKMELKMRKLVKEITELYTKINDIKPDEITQDILDIVQKKIPKDGKDGLVGEKGEKGKDGKDGKDGRDGRDGVDGMDGKDGKDGANGENGNDGSPDTAEDIKGKLESLTGKNKLSIYAIYGWENLRGDSQKSGSGRSIHRGGGGSTHTVSVSSDKYLAENDFVVLADATSGNITVTMPKASIVKHKQFYIKKIDSSANTVTVDGNGANIDDSATSVISTQYASITIVSNGTAWFIV